MDIPTCHVKGSAAVVFLIYIYMCIYIYTALCTLLFIYFLYFILASSPSKGYEMAYNERWMMIVRLLISPTAFCCHHWVCLLHFGIPDSGSLSSFTCKKMPKIGSPNGASLAYSNTHLRQPPWLRKTNGFGSRGPSIPPRKMPSSTEVSVAAFCWAKDK